MIEFLTETQRNNFNCKLNTLSPEQQANPEYLSALYILAGNQEIYDKTSSFFTTEGFKVDKLIENVDLSSSQYLMVTLASNLYNGHKKITPLDLVGITGDLNFKIALMSIEGRRLWG